MNISARNTLRGKIKNITPGAVNTEVIIQLPNGLEIVSVITKDSAERLNLTIGKDFQSAAGTIAINSRCYAAVTAELDRVC